ncbi:50S ribosomal protein L28 [Candidatus Gracilibacteria bacterium]|nr:50S ribosomal protein L28 [Candidatus Gracilibacteria bacterium]
MSRVCQLTGKRPSVGNNRSHALNATKRRFCPNLITKKLFDVKLGRVRNMRISASALRTLTKTK